MHGMTLHEGLVDDTKHDDLVNPVFSKKESCELTPSSHLVQPVFGECYMYIHIIVSCIYTCSYSCLALLIITCMCIELRNQKIQVVQ